MKFLSTNQNSPSVSFREALLQGLAPDGGLYVPEYFPQMPASFLAALPSLSLQEISFEIAKTLIDDLPSAELRRRVQDAISFDAPLVDLARGLYALELFHGPTLAFKDFGARFMARMMSYFREASSKMLDILVATSGDTGSAVASGFYNVAGIRVVLLYPAGQVSGIQQKQLTTWGGNIEALEVSGTFDDCQTLVKQAFKDTELRHHLDLTSANSINIGRLIPQCFYYWYAFAKIHSPGVLYSVPSGNYGNLTAGLWAKQMGLPAGHFIAACNLNSPVPDFLKTGKFQPKTTTGSLSNSMDVGNPSNFQRILNLYNSQTAEMLREFSAFCFSDEETRQAIDEIYQKYRYVADPHGAVGYLGWKAHFDASQKAPAVLLQTAHPAKFPDAVPKEIAPSVPAELSAVLTKTSRSIPMRPEFAQFKSYLLSR